MSFRKTKKSILALDVSPYAIKMLEAIKKNGEIFILSHAEVLIETSIDEALKKICDVVKPRSKRVIMALPYKKIFHKKISVPSTLNENERFKYCLYTASRELNMKIDEINVDYFVCRHINTTQNQTDIELFAVHKQLIEEYEQLIQKANLQLAVVDLDVFALSRAIYYQQKEFEGKYAIINFNKKGFLLVVIDAKQILCAKDFDCGLELEKVFGAISLHFASLDKRPQKIILSGDGDFFEELAEQLTKKLAIKSTIFNPFLYVKFITNGKVIEQKNLSRFAVCFGLLLREFNDSSY